MIEMDLKNTYTIKMRMVKKSTSKVDVERPETEWIGKGSLSNINPSKSFQLLVPDQTYSNKVKVIQTNTIEDVIIVSSHMFHLITEDGTLIILEIMKYPPKYFN